MAQNRRRRHVVILIHGIRTFGAWQNRFATMLAKHRPETEVIIWKFGYFDLIAFLVPFLRIPVIRRFRRFIAEQSEEWRDTDVDIIAHSFGTYVTAWALRGLSSEEAARIDTIIFCGSVLKQLFPWQRMVGTDRLIRRIENLCGTKDQWPVIAQLFVFGMGIAGRRGFAGPTGVHMGVVNRFYSVDHSGFFSDEFMENNWIALLSAEEPSRGEEMIPPTRSFLPMLENYADPLKLIIILVPVIGLYFWWAENQRQLAEQQSLRMVAEANQILSIDPQQALVVAAEILAGEPTATVKISAEETMAIALDLIKRRTAIQLDKNWGQSWLGLVAPSWFEAELSAVHSPDGKSVLVTTKRGRSSNKPPGEALLLDFETSRATLLDIGPAWGSNGAGEIVFTVAEKAVGSAIRYSKANRQRFEVPDFLIVHPGPAKEVLIDTSKFSRETIVTPGSKITMRFAANGLVFLDHDQALRALKFISGHEGFSVRPDIPTRKEKRRLEYVGFGQAGKRIFLSRQYNIESYTRDGVFVRKYPTAGGCTKNPVTFVDSVLDGKGIVFGSTEGWLGWLDPISGRCKRFGRGVMIRLVQNRSRSLGIIIRREKPALIWKIAKPEGESASVELPGDPILTAAFQPGRSEDHFISVSGDGGISFWQLAEEGPKLLNSFNHGGLKIEIAEFSRDGRLLITVDEKARVWAWDPGQNCLRWPRTPKQAMCP